MKVADRSIKTINMNKLHIFKNLKENLTMMRKEMAGIYLKKKLYFQRCKNTVSEKEKIKGME